MDTRQYARLRAKLLLTVLSFSLIPLFALGLFIYDQFSATYTQQVEDNLRMVVDNKRHGIDIFIEERVAQLRTLAATHTLAQIRDEQYLAKVFDTMQSSSKAFVDIGVIDSLGGHVAYVGPFPQLHEVNYSQTEWFNAVMRSGVHVSDVFLGFRNFPHVIIAVARREAGSTWILRATIDSEIFNTLVRSVQAGRSGDAFLVNPGGLLQTPSRGGGAAMVKADMPPPARFSGVRVEDMRIGKRPVIAGSAWLENAHWLLVVSVDPGEALSPLFTTHSFVIAMVVAGALVIFTGAYLVARHITRTLMAAEQEKAVLDASLMQSGKMAALGKLAAGIAHEVNNPLTLIRESAGWFKDLLSEENPDGIKSYQEMLAAADKIEQHVDRAKKVTHRMLGFARRMEPVRENVDLSRLAEQTVQFLENEALYRNIAIRKYFAEDLPVVVSDTAQIQQVALNILENAIDAIGKDGTITLATMLDEKAGRVILSVTDTGPGIPPEHMTRIFDPFFTTKNVGEGTGLGLSIAYGIVEKLGGHLSVQSEVGAGTTFNVALPVGEGHVV
ncbi:MAG: ATP-binding protein [Thermodesulfobacteriota bacterium]